MSGAKIIAGLKEAKQHAALRAAVIEWIREDAPLTIKMVMTPPLLAKLMERLSTALNLEN